jgi:hypothetical protein
MVSLNGNVYYFKYKVVPVLAMKVYKREQKYSSR